MSNRIQSRTGPSNDNSSTTHTGTVVPKRHALHKARSVALGDLVALTYAETSKVTPDKQSAGRLAALVLQRTLRRAGQGHLIATLANRVA